MSTAERAAPLSLAATLTTRALARVLEVHGTLESTNDRARALARVGAAHGTTVVAETQTRGRGQRGRSWHSPEGLGLYVSFLVRPRIPPQKAPPLTLLAGVALHEALQATAGIDARIKWPNDLLGGPGPHHLKKVAGILVEVSAEPSRLDHAVIGIGLNLRDGPRPPELAAYATSVEALAADTGRPPPERAPILAALANALEARLDECERLGFGHVLAAWSRHAAGRGETVELDVDGARTTGVLLGVAEDGALLLDTPGGPQAMYRGELHLPGAPPRPAQRV